MNTPHHHTPLTPAEDAAARRLGEAMVEATAILSAEEYQRGQEQAVRYADLQDDQSLLGRVTAMGDYLIGYCDDVRR